MHVYSAITVDIIIYDIMLLVINEVRILVLSTNKGGSDSKTINNIYYACMTACDHAVRHSSQTLGQNYSQLHQIADQCRS